jgi:hypothetical protein
MEAAMRRTNSAGLKQKELLPKIIGSCLGEESKLAYNWSGKLRATVLGIALARSVRLQDIARTQEGLLKTAENRLSRFLSRKRLALEEEHRRYVESAIRRVGSKRFLRYGGKVVLIIDGTDYPKKRSRRKKRGMPRTGKVRLHNLPMKKPVLVPGYQELWIGLLLKNGRCIGISRKLFSEKMLFFSSQNALEEAEIRRAIQLVKEVLKRDVIVVADRGFKRKELLHWLKKMEKVDFIIRIDGKLSVKMKGWDGLLKDTIVQQPERMKMFWREDNKEAILSEVRSGRMEIKTGSGIVDLYAVCLTPANKPLDPMFLATSLPIRDREALSWVGRAYSKRWTIETFFYEFKQSMRAGAFRVFSSWEAIDRLLTMAHMAFLALVLAYLQVERDPKQRRLMLERLRRWFARPPEFTFGRFMELLAMDFAQHSLQRAL